MRYNSLQDGINKSCLVHMSLISIPFLLFSQGYCAIITFS